MGKSEGENNAVFLADSPEQIRKKVMKAVTDAGPTEPNQEKPAIIQNLFDIMKAVSPASNYEHFDELYNNQQIRYGDFKKQLAEDIIVFTSPIREKILEIGANTDYLKKVAKNGADKARESASKTIKEVREIIGFKSF
jgi:tryptophanyl-tRNA synthetase